MGDKNDLLFLLTIIIIMITAMASIGSASSRRLTPRDAAFFLKQVEETCHRVLARFPAPAAAPKTAAKKRKLPGDDSSGGRLRGGGGDGSAAAAAAGEAESSSSLQQQSKGKKPQCFNEAKAMTTLISPSDRETVEVARVLSERVRRAFERNDCPRCWLPQANCICPLTPAVDASSDASSSSSQKLRCVNRIFVLMHQKEICLSVDTAKMILAAYPENCRLVVAGIGPEYQDSMKELEDALQNGAETCLILFPSPEATTVADSDSLQAKLRAGRKVDVVVIDGTWKQARKIYHRYIQSRQSPNNLAHIRLTDRALAQIAGSSGGNGGGDSGDGRQLRPHPEAWREIGTCAAARYLLQDLEGDDGSGGTDGRYGDHVLARYQARVNEAVQKMKRCA